MTLSATQLAEIARAEANRRWPELPPNGIFLREDTNAIVEYLAKAQRILNAAGFVIVPVEATEEMAQAGTQQLVDGMREAIELGWRVMQEMKLERRQGQGVLLNNQKADAVIAALEAAQALVAEKDRLRGTLRYILTQARANHPGVLSVIIANAEAAGGAMPGPPNASKGTAHD